jgi:hypothetical protein
MDATIHQNMQDLIAVRRLLLHASELEARKKDPHAKVKSLKDAYEEDQVTLSGESHNIDASKASPGKVENECIQLKDLIQQLSFIQNSKKEDGQQGTQVTIREKVSIVEEMEVNYDPLTPVEGLVVRNSQLAETDRYRFEFSDGTTLKIVDKWSGKSTTIWGDPHIDSSDIEGNNDGDIKDLTTSDSHTTFMLQDGTRLTITAREAGIIEAVDIFKGSQHVTGTGAGSKSWSEKNALFNLQVGTGAGVSSLAVGDVVYAGGYGNDWFDANHKLIWGKMTGPVITSRPATRLQVYYRYSETREVAVTINQGV